MKVLFDIPRLQQSPLGMQVYIEHVIGGILDQAPSDWHFSLQTMGLRSLQSHRQRLQLIDIEHRVRSNHLLLPQTIFEKALQFGLSAPLRCLFDVDLVHSFGCRQLPKMKSKALVVAIQDVIPIKLREGPPQFIQHVHATLASLIQQADAIVTISDCSKGDIVEVFGVDPNKIEVIADGVDTDHFRPIQEAEQETARECLARHRVKQPYFLHVGGNPPRKNRPNLIRAFDLLKSQRQLPHHLVLAGAATLDDESRRCIEASSFRDDIINLGYISTADALMILQQAHALVFPSTYEGFGLPPLEAMSCGVPVALSNASALPEVGGNAAVYFDPTNVEEISDAMWQLTADSALRAHCIQSGLARSRKMTWTKNAQQTLSVYRNLCGSSRVQII